ncbi:MAG TPA: hypothetical protein VN703_10190, partial [Candidatus Sulfopaludibacter sp.]|nr:hypothetical protein [Candidatus Sulfopaludibacter sp.]
MKTALLSLVVHPFVIWLLSYDRLSKKPLLFKSFTGLTVQEFDDIYMIKKWQKDMTNMKYTVY